MSHREVSPELKSLVKSYLKRKGRIDWIDWLPLTEIANDTPDQWIAAFNALGTSAGAELVELLGQTDSGPLADALLIILARYALQITDEQIRDFVVEDVSQAIERTKARLSALENACEPLKEHADWVADRLKKGFDIAQEIIRLEKQMAKLRAEEHAKADEYDRIHALEREIIRLETFRRTFSGYDLDERSRYKDELQAETERLKEQKETMQRAIAEQMEQRDSARREVTSQQTEHDNLLQEKDKILAHNAELTGAVDKLKNAMRVAQKDAKRLHVEHAKLLSEIERQEQNNQEADKRIEANRNRLRDLQQEANEAGYIELENRVREVYALLPEDEADKACLEK